ncbi:MAG TPA: LysR family transcriptional regulator [Bacteriovoracaceae bacterium]|nr:LysR family transcriptional regulator [Bacteriovoracaceae bacterium]
MHVFLEHTEKIWIFLKVAECGSLSRAAEELHLTQPAISYAVKTLEDQLGSPLFIRSSKGITLNTAGKMIAQEMNDVKNALIHAEESILTHATSHIPKTLVLGTYESIAVYLWPKFTSAIEQLHPGIELSLITRRSKELLIDVANGKLDAALVVGPIDNNEFHKIHLYQDHYSFYGSGRADTPTTPIITVPDACDSDGKTLKSWIAESSFRDRPLISLSSFEVCAEFASQGLGITILPNRVHDKQFYRGSKLSAVEETGLKDACFGRHDFFFCYRPLTGREDQFKDHLADVIKKML